MPGLEDIEYSHDETVAAFQDFYQLLVDMFLPTRIIRMPPEDGWPNISSGSLSPMGKTEKVIELLRHLPYIDGNSGAQAAPLYQFADWEQIATAGGLGSEGFDGIDMVTANVYTDEEHDDTVAAHVIGLSIGGRDTPMFLLDTELGIIHWFECDAAIRDASRFDEIEDDPEDWAPENEVEWRSTGGTWAIPDFFEVLKDLFRDLTFVPKDSREVIDIETKWTPETGSGEEIIPRLQGIFRAHHWPDLARHDKISCLAELQAVLKEHFPTRFIDWDDEGQLAGSEWSYTGQA